MTLYVTSPNFNVLIIIINFLLAKNDRENILQRTIEVNISSMITVALLITYMHVVYPGEGNVLFKATPNSFLLNEICLNQIQSSAKSA